MGLVIFDLPLRTPLITHTDTHITHDVTLSDCSKRGAIHAAPSPRGLPLPTSRPHIYLSCFLLSKSSQWHPLVWYCYWDHQTTPPREQMTIKIIRRSSHPIEDRCAVLRLFINEKPRSQIEVSTAKVPTIEMSNRML